jgi:hypothetical protein
MKDIVIPGRLIAREVRVFLICFAAALLLNAGCILYYHTRWIELLTTAHIALAVASMFYAVAAVVRLTAKGAGLLRGHLKKMG